MLRLIGRADSLNVRKVLWLLDELGLAYERTDIGGRFGGNDTPEYRALNPTGLIPTLVDGDHAVWQSNTICRYLAARHAPDLLGGSIGERSQIEAWMDWQLAEAMPVMAIIHRQLFKIPEVERDPALVLRTIPEVARALQVLETRMNGREYVIGDRFTLADIPAGLVVNRWFTAPIERPALPNLAAYHERLKEREPYRRHAANGLP